MAFNQEESKRFSRIPDPRDAVTVVIVRKRVLEPFEILLMRRQENQSFLGGAFVFPGGSLDKSDIDPALAAWARGLSPREAKIRLNEPDLTEEKALGLFFAAVRETFEEAGILLAESHKGITIKFSEPNTSNKWQIYRSKIRRLEMSLLQLAQKEKIRFPFDRFIPYSHWITPRIESKRFDTRFMIMRLPSGQNPTHDSIEMSDSLWITPQKALEKHEHGRILLMPPTLKHVEEFSQFPSIEAFLSFASSRKIKPVLPQPFQTENGWGLKLPHDPEYSLAAYKQPLKPDEPSRIMLIDGNWKTICFQSTEKKADGDASGL